MFRPALLLLVLGGCVRHQPPAPPPNEVIFTGTCDASGAVALSAERFLVADDEDNVLRTYDARRGGTPEGQVEISAALDLPRTKKGPPEADIEAATRIGQRAYFITSHARSSGGKLKPERLRFFATTAPASGQAALIGRPYAGLLADLLAEPRLEPFGLREAAERAPKKRGGLNIEGMTARKEGGVWLGFRNPLPQGRALLVPLLNPEGLVQAEPARFGDPVTLDLRGLGVRALADWGERYLIVAGAADGERSAAALFSWDGGGRVEALVQGAQLRDYNPEALINLGGPDFLALSDDGSRQVEGTECKRLKQPDRKSFRGRWLKLPPRP